MSFPSAPYVNVAQARSVANELTFRLSQLAVPLTVTNAFDTNNVPLLTIAPSSGASWTTGQQYAIVQFNLVPTINVDALGLTQTVYTPMLLQVCVEGNTAGTGSPFPATSDFNSVLSWATELALMGTLLRVGAKVQVYNSGHGVQPVIASIVAANLVASFDDLINPLTSSR
jgi:hypothetical protein